MIWKLISKTYENETEKLFNSHRDHHDVFYLKKLRRRFPKAWALNSPNPNLNPNFNPNPDQKNFVNYVVINIFYEELVHINGKCDKNCWS